MLNQIDEQDQIEASIGILKDVPQFKAQFLVGSFQAEVEGLAGDFITAESAIFIHAILQLLQDFTRSAAHLADRFGRKIAALDHAENLNGLPGGIFEVPGGILLQIFTAGVHFLWHGCSSEWQAYCSQGP